MGVMAVLDSPELHGGVRNCQCRCSGQGWAGRPVESWAAGRERQRLVHPAPVLA